MITITYWDTPPAGNEWKGYKVKTFKKAGLWCLLYCLFVAMWHDRYTWEEE